MDRWAYCRGHTKLEGDVIDQGIQVVTPMRATLVASGNRLKPSPPLAM